MLTDADVCRRQLWRQLFDSHYTSEQEGWAQLVQDLQQAGAGAALEGSMPAQIGEVEEGGDGGGGRAGRERGGGKTERRVYVEVMHLHPVLLHLQFTPTGEIAEMARRVGRSSGTLVCADVC